MFHYDNSCLYKNNRPWFPFMGEIHYSRLPAREWRDALLKMKAGGIDVVASYTFWIHHEECRGEWDFEGPKNLRAFVETVKDCKLYMFLRIGPWSHGEARNGGFPDWLMQDGCKIRTNDPAYFEIVHTFYSKLFEQVQGLMFKDGGPIIGIQIENEYGHVGGLTGQAGEAHMRTLTTMAKDIGFDAPIFTATGWNGAVTGGLLPVMGGYCDAPWHQGIDEIEPSGNFIFSYERNDTSIGSDAGFGVDLSYDTSQFPYITAELGGGLQVTHHRRTVPSPQDIAAMSIAKLGSGVNLLGYYMYHGGVNPQGKLTTLQETRASGGYNDLPELSYDFHAPLGAYGQYHESYHELRILGMFVADFGETLCKMPAYIPDPNPQNPSDRGRLRYSFRHNGSWGYMFFNNHVRHMMRPVFPQVAVAVPKMDLRLPTFDIMPGQYGFYPFNMPVDGGVIKFAQATPLCTIGKTTVLYGTQADATGDVLLISREDALRAYKIRLCSKRAENDCEISDCSRNAGERGTERLVISDNPVIQDGDEVHIFATQRPRIKVYPAWDSAPDGFTHTGTDGPFAIYENKGYESKMHATGAKCQVTKLSATRYRLQFSGLDQSHDYDCKIKYTADSAKAYANDHLIMDDFYKDGQWYIGLKRHNFPSTIEIELTPLNSNAQVYLEAWPQIENGSVCRIDSVEVIPITRVRFKIPQ